MKFGSIKYAPKVFSHKFFLGLRKFLLLLIFFLSVSNTSMAFNDSLIELTNPYLKDLKKNTRSDVRYTLYNLEAKVQWTATYISPYFREVFEQRFFELYPHGQEGAAGKYLQKLANPNQTEFFIAFYANKKSLKNLEGEDSLWSLRLIIGNEVIKPLTVEAVELNAFYQKFYPYFSNHFRGYRVVFPFSPAQRPELERELNISSVAGKSSLYFQNY